MLGIINKFFSIWILCLLVILFFFLFIATFSNNLGKVGLRLPAEVLVPDVVSEEKSVSVEPKESTKENFGVVWVVGHLTLLAPADGTDERARKHFVRQSKSDSKWDESH